MHLSIGSSPEDVRAAWADALESGDYIQGRDCLTFQTGTGRMHCCWGVLAALGIKAGLVTEGATGPDGKVRYVVANIPNGWVSCVNYAPTALHEWAGMDQDLMCQYADANDRGVPFSRIAAAVRANDVTLLPEQNMGGV